MDKFTHFKLPIEFNLIQFNVILYLIYHSLQWTSVDFCLTPPPPLLVHVVVECPLIKIC